MSAYTWPAVVPRPRRTQLRLLPAIKTFTSPYSRQTQAVDLMAELWRMQLDLPDGIDKVIGGAIEAMFDRLKGQANTLALWNFSRPAPRGTMRGAPTLSASAAQLANTISISGSGTLLAGDMIGVGGQLCRVMADASVPGSVEIAPRLRVAMASGTAVTWDKPTAAFLLMSDGAGVDWMPGGYSGTSVEFIESL